MKRTAVIGAGPAGMTAAYQLAKAGVAVDVYEASSSVGGLAKTISLWDQKVDIGPHRFFSNDTRVNSLWLEVAGKDYRMVDRLTRIYYKKKFFYYPLKPADALRKLGLGNATLCMVSYMKQQLGRQKRNEGSFEDWVIARFGKKLYSIFFKTYTEKLWGIPCNKLDADFAAQRIKKLSLWEAVKHAVIKGKNEHKTLVDQFAYPLEGTGMIYERMAKFVNENNGRVLLNKPVRKIITEEGKAKGIELENGETSEYDEIISTMPLTHMVKRIDGLPEEIALHCNALKFRNTIIVFLLAEGKDIFADNWLYIHAADLQTGRITNFRNWVPEINGAEEDTIIAMEFWCNDEDLLWQKAEDELIEMAKSELKQTGLCKEIPVTKGSVYKIPRCYPVYARGYKEHLKPVENYLTGIEHLHVIGRYGAFKYNNQDHSILMGMLAADNIITGAKNNLWEINTDYEDYQEKSTITASGLQKSPTIARQYE